jgi:hypothetical protein
VISGRHKSRIRRRRQIRFRRVPACEDPDEPRDAHEVGLSELGEWMNFRIYFRIPNIGFGWGNATISLQTKKIKGLHENDFIMASQG